MSSFLRNRGRLFHVVCRGRTNKTPTRPTTTPTPTTTTTTTTTTIKNEIQYTERGGKQHKRLFRCLMSWMRGNKRLPRFEVKEGDARPYVPCSGIHSVARGASDASVFSRIRPRPSAIVEAKPTLRSRCWLPRQSSTTINTTAAIIAYHSTAVQYKIRLREESPHGRGCTFWVKGF